MTARRLVGLVVIVVAALISSSVNSRKTTRSRAGTAAGDSVTGKVVSIADGDTLTVLDETDEQHRIRLFGIDAPEKSQAFGTQSKENLARKVFGKVVRVEIVDIDRYHRQVGRIYLGGRFINMEQVRDGFAWRYTHYDRQQEFVSAESEARDHRRGLWADPRPVPPWEYRREHSIGERAARHGSTPYR